MKLAALQEKISRLSWLREGDVSPWEQGFIATVVRLANRAASVGEPTTFSDAQIDKIDELYDRHFGAGAD